ncbi:hypothetical protein I4U23_010069 [Adineta vaga]|nr:hypothetical protein I4U23_010069 [Adineta vaga]
MTAIQRKEVVLSQLIGCYDLTEEQANGIYDNTMALFHTLYTLIDFSSLLEIDEQITTVLVPRTMVPGTSIPLISDLMSIINLPEHVLYNLCKYLSFIDILNLSKTCKHFYILIENDNYFWKILIKSHFGFKLYQGYGYMLLK